MKKFVALLAVMLAFAPVANAQWDMTTAATKVKEVADDATAKVEAKKAEAEAKKAEAEAKKAEEQKAAEAKKAEQQKAIDDAKTSLGNLKNALSN